MPKHRLLLALFSGLGLAVLILVLVVSRSGTDKQPKSSFQLTLPIDCAPGKTCWIVNYVDHDPTDGVRDYMCGEATYNGADGSGHNGTDFAIRDLSTMRRGVVVMAAGEGVVKGVRDGMDDVDITSTDGPKSLGGKNCGNGVRLDHGAGWSSQYCHLRKGSVAVKPGQKVKAADHLGYVGLSGLTQFPHLHLTIRKEGKVVDPFVGAERKANCGPGPEPLWDRTIPAMMPYRPTAIYNAGFAPEKPSVAKARNGDYERTAIASSAPALVLWAEMFNLRAGDQIFLSVQSPTGETLVNHKNLMKKNKARFFSFAGRPLRSSAWPTGTYDGQIRIVRPIGDGKARVIKISRKLSVR